MVATRCHLFVLMTIALSRTLDMITYLPVLCTMIELARLTMLCRDDSKDSMDLVTGLGAFG